MLILNAASKKTIFVHIQKTGGSSIRKILKAQLGELEEFGCKQEKVG